MIKLVEEQDIEQGAAPEPTPMPRSRLRLLVYMVVLTALLTSLAWVAVPPSYVVDATALLRSPVAVSDGDDAAGGSGNPYAADGNLRVLGSVVTSVLQQNSVRQDLRRQGAVADYEVGQDWTSAAPMIGYRITGRTPAAVATTASLLLERTEQVTADRQEDAGAHPSTWIALEVVQPPTAVRRDTGTRKLAATAVFIVLSLTTVRLVRTLRRRERERERENAPGQVVRSIF
jgi:hypothetical protein